MSDVIVYTTDSCSRCLTAKTLLNRRGVSYQEINLARDPDGRAALAEKTGMVTFPQIMIGDEPLGGADDLIAADRNGRLQALLGSSAA